MSISTIFLSSFRDHLGAKMEGKRPFVGIFRISDKRQAYASCLGSVPQPGPYLGHLNGPFALCDAAYMYSTRRTHKNVSKSGVALRTSEPNLQSAALKRKKYFCFCSKSKSAHPTYTPHPRQVFFFCRLVQPAPWRMHLLSGINTNTACVFPV
jgi:hypothetical protein